MCNLIVDRWVDIDSVEAQTLDHYNMIKKIVRVGIEGDMIVPTNDGYLYMKDGTPVHAELAGKFIGLRYSAKAAN